MNGPTVDRRTLLRGVGGVGALAAVTAVGGCGTGTRRTGEKALVVRSSGGAYQEANEKIVFTPFSKETGITVRVANLQHAEMVAQVKQGRPQFDLIDNSMLDLGRMAKKDVLAELDVDRVKSLEGVRLAKSLVNDHAVAKNYWASVQAYRTDVFKDKPPADWADFWDVSAFSGKRSLQSQDADMPELEFALLADGVAMEDLYPIDIDRAFKAMTRIRDSVTKFWDTGALPAILLGRKEVSLTSVWHGRLDSLIDGGSPLAYQYRGARRQSNGWAIPKGTEKTDLAYQLIDYSLRPDVQAAFAREYPNGPVVPKANAKLSDEVQSRLVTSPQHLKSGFDIDTSWWLANEAKVLKRWAEWARA